MLHYIYTRPIVGLYS